MKRMKHTVCVVLALLLTAACSKDDTVPEPVIPPDDGMEEMSFTASAPVIGATSGEGGAEETYPLLWNDGDAIGVMPVYGAFDESEVQNMKFTASIEGGTAATAAFTGRTLPSEDGYFAFYPHSRFVRYEGDVDVDNTFIYFTLPSEQKAVAGGFERGLFPSYAVADAAGGEMQFTPVCGLVKFRLTGDAVADIASVSFDVMGYSVSGMFGLNTTFGWLEESPSCKSRVTLTGPFEAETDYYMVVMPGWLSDFYFTFTRQDGSVYLREGGIEDGRIAVGGMADFGTMELSEGDFAVPAEDDITDLAFIKAVEMAAGITLERNAVGYVPLTEANLETMASVTELDLSFDELFDASALKYFTGLRRLDCSYNNLGSLDVSSLKNLTELDCSYNFLTELTVAGAAALEALHCYENDLKTLDVSSLRNLTNLGCSSNQLSELKLGEAGALTRLNCSYNSLTELDVSMFKNLTELDCSSNSLTELTVAGAAALEEVDCASNHLTALDMGGLSNLQTLYCSGNELSTLDLSEATALKQVNCHYNLLTRLDVSAMADLEYLFCFGNRMSELDISANGALQKIGCGNQTDEAEAERTLTLRLTAAQRDGVWAATNSDPMFETYNTNVTLDVTDE